MICFEIDELQQCETLRVDLKNIALNTQGKTQGTYQKSAYVNGKPSWVSNNQAIWWISEYNEWAIGDLTSLGTDIRGITAVTDNKTKSGLPENPTHTWKYWNGASFVTVPDANDISVECVDEEIITTTMPTTTTPTLEGNDIQ